MTTQPESDAVELFSQTLRGVEIMRAGVWNGLRFTERDLDDMVQAAGELGYRPVVKLGHSAQDSDPAYGYVVNLRRIGDRLVCDFEQVPDELVEAIRAGRYASVSAEVFLNLKRDGRVYRRALRAVAVLGADIPAVDNLRDLASTLSTPAVYGTASAVWACTERAPLIEDEDEAMSDIVANDTADRLAAAEAELAKLRAQLDENKSAAIKLAQAEQRIAELEAQATAAREAARQADIAKLVDSVQVPAFRAEIHALLDLATRASQSGQLVTFSTGDGTAAAADPVDVVKALVGKLNARATMIFGEASLSYADRQWMADSTQPDVEIARLCQSMISSGAARTMSEAREKLRANPQHRELFARYAQASN